MKISRFSKYFSIILSIVVLIILIIFNFIFRNNENKNSEEEIAILVSEINLEDKIVYDNMTIEELSDKIERSLNSSLSGYGSYIASYSLERGIDPYLATAIILHETGCTNSCSNLVNSCNNVGGMKGIGCGEYAYFSDLHEGITKFIDNLYNTYYVYGLTNAQLMGPKYAEDPNWAIKVNRHLENIKNR